ncbi:MAG: hypothetical protein E6Q53_01655 [Candidatus Moraniibacteriota bacterium]|nr:MAG: hypothetical protein E6Q53_01655 [Candidatus Moranbacteria bacterium]
MTILIVHLSDIHIHDQSDAILARPDQIAASTYSALPDVDAVFIVISGDVAQSGKEAEYQLASVFLRSLAAGIREERDVPVHFVIAPGNHDCNFDRDNKMRQMAVRCLSTDPDAIDDSVVDQCTSIQAEYFAFCKEITDGVFHTGDKLWMSQSFDIVDKKIVFDAINLSWVSKLNEEQGGIVFPFERYQSKESESCDARIVVMHHPMNWHRQNIYRPFRKFVRGIASIVITGHEHQGNCGENIDSETGWTAYIEADVLQDRSDGTKSAFNLVEIDLEGGLYRTTRYDWSEDHYGATEEGSWFDYRNLPTKQKNIFEIEESFRAQIDDPGANFGDLAHGKITLTDIYVFPDLLTTGVERRSTRFASSSILRDPEKTADGVILEGDEKVGGTSLLYQLFDSYFERGYFPIFIKGASFKGAGSRNVQQVIERAVAEQYGTDAVERYAQQPAVKKLLLLDDFDDVQVKTLAGKAEILTSLRKRFGHIVVTVSQLFEVRELLQEIGADEMAGLTHYQIQPLGYTLRGKLVRKWCNLCNDGTQDDAAVIGKCDQAEKAMDMIIGRNIIPAMPLYLLTLMQSIEAGRSGEFKDSSLGHYYGYLLTQSLLTTGVRPDRLNEYLDYCTELAWFYHSQKSREIEETELAGFNRAFSAKWHTVDFSDRFGRLVSAKVLMKRGNYYSFRYPYIYYFLKGRYLSRNIDDVEIRLYIEKCCSHLYVREHANTVLFLAHHTNNQFVVDAILSVLRGLFKQHKPVLFSGDTHTVSALIADAGKLKYSGTPPEEFREHLNETRDQLDDGTDGLAEAEENGDDLSLVAQLVTLFKTVEILGQVLKNQYSSIERHRKTEVLEELFSGPLRALAGFYEFITKNPDLIVAEIDYALKHQAKLDDDEARMRIAKHIAARVVQGMSLGFVCKASSSVNSESLREDIATTVKRLDSPAFRLIELGVLLDSAAPIPKEALLKTKEDTKAEAIPASLLNLLILRRLYMFRMPEKDKQWLAAKIDVDLASQHAVDFRTTKMKRLKQQT